MKKLSLIILSLISLSTKATNYYFSSVSGNDANSGTSINSPWQNLTKLTPALWTSMSPGDSILLKRGEVFYGSITPGRSGTASLPIVISAYGTGSKPIVSGLTAVTGWTETPAGSHIWVSTAVTAGLSSLNMLTINGVPAAKGRYPNADAAGGGYLTIDTHSGATSLTDASMPASAVAGAEVVIRTRRWVIEKRTISTKSANTITYSTLTYEPDDDWGYFIQNSSSNSVLDQPGEWYYDPSTKKVTIYSTSNPGSTVKIATIQTLVTLSSRSYIKFVNVQFEGSNTDNISISGGSNINVEYCTLKNSGDRALYTLAFTNQTGLTADHDSIINSMSIAIESNSNRNFITNNYIYNTGMFAGLSGSGEGAKGTAIALRHLDNKALVQYNSIKRTNMSAIYFKNDAGAADSDSIEVRNNYCDSSNLLKDDDGAIYTWAGVTDPPVYQYRIIDGNIVKHTLGNSDGTSTSFQSGYGIYFDLGSSDITCSNNYVDSSGRAGIYVHAGNERLVITGNTLYNNGLYMGTDPRGTQLYFVQDNGRLIQNNTIIHNIMWSSNNIYLVRVDNESATLPTIGTFDSNYYVNFSTKTKPFATQIFNTDSNKIITTGLAFSDWKSTTGFDASSTQKLITASDIVRSDYSTFSASQLNLQGYRWVDAKNVSYAAPDLTLSPWSSVVLVKEAFTTLSPLADAFVRGGDSAAKNYGLDTSLIVKTSSSATLNRHSYLKFGLNNLTGVISAKLRVYGHSTTAGETVNMSVYGVTDDSWIESGVGEITWNNKPAPSGSALSSIDVTDQFQYYDLDVTDFVKTQLGTDSTVSLLLKNISNSVAALSFNSKENTQNRPQLIIVTPVTVGPLADAYVRGGTFTGDNFGSDVSLIVKTSSSPSLNRNSHLKFPLNGVAKITSAKLRLYGRNTEDAVTVNTQVYASSDANDTWTENGITFTNQPATSGSSLNTTGVNDVLKYYEWDVTNYVQAQFAGNKIVSFIVRDSAGANRALSFNSRENGQYNPQLVIDDSGPITYPRGLFISDNKNDRNQQLRDNAFPKTKVFPNPAKNSFIVTFPQNQYGTFDFRLTDQLGRMYDLGKRKIQPGESYTAIDISKLGLPAGVYYLMIHSQKMSHVEKLMVR